ncbi:FtsX-like permease family protein [Microvirga sp. W0021]|uniref:FtsX-like permease family protein n=1 Tax=Hohaiivirga grylli TaxID=3133970 RepID=A0ABV0BEV2_9HYPH
MNNDIRSSGLFSPSLILKLMLRELRSGLAGFGIFLGCLALGVGAIASVGSTSRALNDGLSQAGSRILGGDMSFSQMQREISDKQRVELERLGPVSSIAILRTMARSGDEVALVEIKAVDEQYPVVGDIEVEPSLSLPEIFRSQNGIHGIAADTVLFDRLGLKPGDQIKIGDITLELRAKLLSEPDKLGAGIGFGPRVLMSQEALRASGLLQPGSLVRWTYRLSLARLNVPEAKAAIENALPDMGWDVRTKDRADPRFAQEVERFSQFLTLVGLTALLVGGVGVANAVRSYVDRKRTSFAVLKSIGASGGLAVTIYFVTIFAIACIGVLIGCLVGITLPFAIAYLFGDMLPVPLEPAIAWSELFLAVCYGLLTAVVFAIAPLGRMHDTPVTSLFREEITPTHSRLRKRYWVILAVSIVTLLMIAVITAYDRKVALIFIGAALFAFIVLRAVAIGTMAIARRMPRSKYPVLRLAMANIYRPGALTPSLVLSLGLGLSLLVTLGVVDSNLRNELTRVLPEKAPSFFFLDIPAARVSEFDQLLNKLQPDIHIERVPNMRGRIVQIKDKPTSAITAPPEASWVLEGDRGITYSAKIPDGSELTEGTWWPEDYKGKPLVSFEEKVASALGLKIGDDITVNVLGRNITATIANLRAVNWRSLGINFVMVFSPNTFTGAPHTELATASLPDNTGKMAQEAVILRQVAREFPSVTTVRVKDQLDAFSSLIGQLLFAVRGVSLVALAASLLVLAGAFAANQRARLYDAVILKTLGATRKRLISIYLLEYGFLAILTAVFGLIVGTLAAYFILTQTMKLSFAFLLGGTLLTVVIAVIFVVILGLSGTWSILKQKPAAVLKEL